MSGQSISLTDRDLAAFSRRPAKVKTPTGALYSSAPLMELALARKRSGAFFSRGVA